MVLQWARLGPPPLWALCCHRNVRDCNVVFLMIKPAMDNLINGIVYILLAPWLVSAAIPRFLMHT